MLKLKYALVILLAPWASSQVFASVSASGEELVEGLRLCRTIEDRLARVECYDRVVSSLGEQHEEPAVVESIEELAPSTGGGRVETETTPVELAPSTGGGRVETETAPEELAPPPGSWILKTETNPLDGTTTTSATLPAVGDRSRRRRPVALVLQCQSREFNILINWGEYLRSESPSVTTRIDADPQVNARWSRSPDKHATIYWPSGTKRSREENIKIFALELLTAEKLVARVVPQRGGSITAAFELSGVAAALRSVRQACGW